MSPAVATRPLLDCRSPRTIGRADASLRPPDSSGGGGLTLEARLDCVWEGLRADGAAECPVCHGCMDAAGVCCSCHSRLG